MKRRIAKKTKSSELRDAYHKEILVLPAKRLLDALLKTEEEEMSTLQKVKKVSTSS